MICGNEVIELEIIHEYVTEENHEIIHDFPSLRFIPAINLLWFSSHC